MSDKKKIVILSLIIGVFVILIIFVSYIAYLSFVDENKVDNTKPSTTTRRTIESKDDITTTTSTSFDSSTTTTNNSTSTTPTNSTSSTTKTTKNTNNTQKTTSTSKKKLTKKTTTPTTTKKVSIGQSVIPIPNEREVTYESTDYPNADDEGAWKIVDMINEARIKNGLKPVEVAVELRRLAEEAADFWYEYSDSEIKNYLYGHSNYRRVSNQLYTDSAYLSMYNSTVQNTKVTTNKNIRYVGVGLIYRVNGMGGLATHYYVIIYE